MSRAAALIWVLIALILGLVVWFTTPRTVLPSATLQFLPDFSPARVTEIDLAWPGGESAHLAKADSRWILRTTSSNKLAPWPAESTRVQGLLRLLAEARQAGDARAMPTAIFLTLTCEGGETIRLALDPNALGGAGRIARLGADGRVQAVASVDEQFVRVLDAAALESWRSKDLLYWPPEATTELASRAESVSIELAKSGGAWIMHEPVAIKADAATVEGSLLLLSKSGIDRFVNQSPGGDEDWKKPARTILLASRPNAAGKRREIRQIIEIGPTIDSSSRMIRIVARDPEADTVLWGPQLAIMNNAALEAIPSAPGAFVSRIALDLPAADIASIEIESSDHRAVVKRSAGGTFDKAEAPIRELLRLLAESPAAQVRILEPSAAAPRQPGADSVLVRALGPKAEPLGEFVLKPTSIAAKISGAPSTPAIEVTEKAVSRSIPWQRPGDFLATLRAIATP